MKAITRFYSDGDVDITNSIKATIEASDAPFTTQDVFDALSQANPTDEYLDLNSVRRVVVACSTPAVGMIDELSDGRYVRKGIEVVEAVTEVAEVTEVSEPVVRLQVRPEALNDPSIIEKRPVEWSDLTNEAKDVLSR